MENHIFIGLGGTGTKILQCLKKKVKEEGLENLPWGFVCVDTDDILRYENKLICPSEFVHINTSLAKKSIDCIDCFPHIKSWYGDKDSWIRLLEDYSGYGTKQCRRLGRLLFSLHENDFLNCIRCNVMTVQNKSHNHDVKFHVIASCCGGFGSGAIMEVLSCLKQYCHDGAQINVYAKVPSNPIPPLHDIGRYEANAYKALEELNAWLIDTKEQRILSSVYLFSNNLTSGDFLLDDELYSNITSSIVNIINNTEFNLYNESTFFEQRKVINNECNGFNALGSCSIIYPAQKIKEYFELFFKQQVLTKLLCNSWFDSLGYVIETTPRTCDLTQDELNRFFLSDEHLTKTVPINESDRYFDKEYFSNRIDCFDYKEIKDHYGSQIVIHGIENEVDKYYSEIYNTIGVHNFYTDHANDSRYCKHIINIIKEYHTNQLISCNMSLHDIEYIIKSIIDYLSSRTDRLKSLIESCNQTIQEKEALISENRKRYYEGFILTRFIKGKSIFNRHKQLLKEKYTLMATIEGLLYAQGLIPQLLHELHFYFREINDCIHRIISEIENISNLKHVLGTELGLYDSVNDNHCITYIHRPEVLKNLEQQFLSRKGITDAFYESSIQNLTKDFHELLKNLLWHLSWQMIEEKTSLLSNPYSLYTHLFIVYNHMFFNGGIESVVDEKVGFMDIMNEKGCETLQDLLTSKPQTTVQYSQEVLAQYDQSIYTTADSITYPHTFFLINNFNLDPRLEDMINNIKENNDMRTFHCREDFVSYYLSITRLYQSLTFRMIKGANVWQDKYNTLINDEHNGWWNKFLLGL